MNVFDLYSVITIMVCGLMFLMALLLDGPDFFSSFDTDTVGPPVAVDDDELVRKTREFNR